MGLNCPRCGVCNFTTLFRSPIDPAEDRFRCDDCGKQFRRYDERSQRPNYDLCDDRLKRRIDDAAQEMLNDVYNAVWAILDSTSVRFVLTGEDAGELARRCVAAIADDLPECLAK